MYGAFPVCRNYTVRAYLRNAGITKWSGCQNRQQYVGTLRCGFHPPHLHPRYEAEAGRGSTNDGQLHGASHVSRKNAKIAERRQKPPLRYSLNLSAHFRVWVTVWVRQLTHILTHTIFSIFATKKHRNPKFSMLFGAAGQIRTADLILTKRRRAFQPLQYKAFRRFFVQKG